MMALERISSDDTRAMDADSRRRHALARALESDRPRLRRPIIRVCGDVDAADDLLQETARRALSAETGFRGDARPSSYLFRVAVTVAQRFRAGRRATDSLPPGIAAPIETDPAACLVRADSSARLYAAIDALPDELRTPLVLFAWEGLKYREIADMLQIPTGTVMSRLSAARKRLREEFADEDR